MSLEPLGSEMSPMKEAASLGEFWLPHDLYEQLAESGTVALPSYEVPKHVEQGKQAYVFNDTGTGRLTVRVEEVKNTADEDADPDVRDIVLSIEA